RASAALMRRASSTVGGTFSWSAGAAGAGMGDGGGGVAASADAASRRNPAAAVHPGFDIDPPSGTAVRRPSGEPPFYRVSVIHPTPAEGISKPPGDAATGREARAYDAFMSHTSRIGRLGKLTALVLLALTLGPSLAWCSTCATCPQTRTAAHPCCQVSASVSREMGRWAPGCCGRLAAPTALAVREVQAQESLAADVLPAS